MSPSPLQVINEGRASALTSSNALLAIATETLNKLSYQLDDVNSRVETARVESRIMNQYRSLIDASRMQFAQELKSILPHIDVHAKGQSGDSCPGIMFE
jgi:hypothetical protein